MHFLIGAIAAALLAAIGNAIFSYGQKQAGNLSNPMLFNACTFGVALICMVVATPFFSTHDAGEQLKTTWLWYLLTGVGTAITYIGFYWLYSRYGASYYALYGILALLTTAIGVGVIIFKESFNIYYLLSIVAAVITLVLFLIGKQQAAVQTPS